MQSKQRLRGMIGRGHLCGWASGLSSVSLRQMEMEMAMTKLTYCSLLAALNPHMLLCAPTAIMSIILIRMHAIRFPVGRPLDEVSNAKGSEKTTLILQTPAQALARAIEKPSSTGHGAVRPPLIPNPPHEGTIKYYENLRDIQNM